MNGDQRSTVVFFHPASDSFTGGPKMLYRLVKSLDRSRFEPIILSQRYDELCKRAENEGVQVEIIPFKGALDTYNHQLLSSSLIGKGSAAARLLQFNAEAREVLLAADIIWCKNLRALLTILPFSLLSDKIFIWNIGLAPKAKGAVSYLQKIALITTDYVFIESERQARTVFGSEKVSEYSGKFAVFHKGIDTTRFDPDQSESTSNDRIVIGTAASITPRKGLEYFVDAAIQLSSERDDLRFVIAGDVQESSRDYKQELAERISREGLSDQIEFIGWIDDMPQFYADLDIFVLPSLQEGIPGAVREAQAMELPTVATNVGGTADVLVDEETGLLVPPESTEDIVEALEYLLNRPDERHEMGQAGRQRIVDEFSVEQYVRKYENFLSKLTSGGYDESA